MKRIPRKVFSTTFIVAKTSNKKDFQILNNVIFGRFLYSNVLKNGENIVPLQLK